MLIPIPASDSDSDTDRTGTGEDETRRRRVYKTLQRVEEEYRVYKNSTVSSVLDTTPERKTERRGTEVVKLCCRKCQHQ